MDRLTVPNDLKKSNIAYFFIGALLFMFSLTRISSIPVQFVFLELGKITGPIPSLIILLLVPAVIFFFTLYYLKKKSKLRNLVSRLNTKKVLKLISVCIFAYLIVSLIFSVVFFPLVIQKREKITDPFIQQNIEQTLEEKVINIEVFLNGNVNYSGAVDKALFEMDEHLFISLFDPYLLDSWKISRADIIVYQGWGSCGQAALLIEELLTKFGYETRRAQFIGIDHGWAEVKNGTQWLIVDPWYIGNLVNIEDLKNLKPAFQKATGVKVYYGNGTILELTEEYGY